MITLWGSLGGKFHTGLSMPVDSWVDLHQKLGDTLAEFFRSQPEAKIPAANNPSTH